MACTAVPSCRNGSAPGSSRASFCSASIRGSYSQSSDGYRVGLVRRKEVALEMMWNRILTCFPDVVAGTMRSRGSLSTMAELGTAMR